MSGSDDRRVLWAATVRAKPLAERITAATAAGYDAMLVVPVDLAAWRDEGLPPQEAGRMIADAGLAVAALDPFTQWVPDWSPPDEISEDDLAFVDFDTDEILKLADAIGAEAINCVEPFGDAHAEQALIDAFRDFADRAGAEGYRIALEFMPISGIPDLPAGRAIALGADRSNAGLVFDIWHFVRSGSAIVDVTAQIADKIFEVQVADGKIPMAGDDMMDDLMHHRLPPGEGDFPLAAIRDRLREHGALRSIGPELFSDAMDAKSARDAARRALAATEEWIGHG